MDSNKKIDEKIFANKNELKSLIEYQEGTIVSRTLLKSSAGNITLFAFDEGQGLSEHTAPFDAFVQVIEGKAKIIISGNEHYLSEGECILMPANDPHAVYSDGRFKMHLTMIKA